MIKKIKQSPLDKQYLALRPYTATPINVDFKNVLVNKPWGNEYLMFGNDEIELWNLFIRHQRATSMHCHPNKKTTLMVLEGRALFSSLNESWELLPMDTVVIDSGVFHSTQSISKEGLRLLEFENPPMKHDLVRLEDKYGRAQTGYEGAEQMTADNERVRLFGATHGKSHDVSGKKMYIYKISDQKDINAFKDKKDAFAVILGGAILSDIGEPLYSATNVLTLEELVGTDIHFENLSILLVEP